MNKPRLIDANVLLEKLPYPTDYAESEFYGKVLDVIEELPTAYDIDEIVEKLEKAAKIYRDKAVIELSTEGHTLDYEHFEGKSKAFLNAIEIVKGGGSNV